MPCASYQWISACRTLPLLRRIIAIPLSFRQRPGPYCFRNRTRSRMPLPVAIVSMAVTSPMISNDYTSGSYCDAHSLARKIYHWPTMASYRSLGMIPLWKRSSDETTLSCARLPMWNMPYQKTLMRIYPKVVTRCLPCRHRQAECFYRGSILLTKTLSRRSKGRGVHPACASPACRLLATADRSGFPLSRERQMRWFSDKPSLYSQRSPGRKSGEIYMPI